MTIAHCPEDLSDMLAADGSIDLALNVPGHSSRVRHTRSWWGGSDETLVVGTVVDRFVTEHPQWQVLHSVYVPSLDAEIDALVVGPSGVFVVQAAYVPDARVWAGGETFIVDGQKKSYVAASRAVASHTRKVLAKQLNFGVPVTGIVVPVGAHEVDVPLPSEGVVVLEPEALEWWLGQIAHPWTGRQVASTFEVARRSSTWHAA